MKLVGQRHQGKGDARVEVTWQRSRVLSTIDLNSIDLILIPLIFSL